MIDIEYQLNTDLIASSSTEFTYEQIHLNLIGVGSHDDEILKHVFSIRMLPIMDVNGAELIKYLRTSYLEFIAYDFVPNGVVRLLTRLITAKRLNDYTDIIQDYRTNNISLLKAFTEIVTSLDGVGQIELDYVYGGDTYRAKLVKSRRTDWPSGVDRVGCYYVVSDRIDPENEEGLVEDTVPAKKDIFAVSDIEIFQDGYDVRSRILANDIPKLLPNGGVLRALPTHDMSVFDFGNSIKQNLTTLSYIPGISYAEIALLLGIRVDVLGSFATDSIRERMDISSTDINPLYALLVERFHADGEIEVLINQIVTTCTNPFNSDANLIGPMLRTVIEFLYGRKPNSVKEKSEWYSKVVPLFTPTELSQSSLCNLLHTTPKTLRKYSITTTQ